MTATCERYAVELSALLDRELGPEEVLLVVDHLVECPSCRAFWGAARGLEASLDELRGEGGAALPADLWERIRTAAGERDEGRAASPPQRSPSRRWSWVLGAAAAVVAAAGLAALVLPRVAPERDGAQAYRMGSIGVEARMDEDRLLAVAGELLRADPRDRAALVDILVAVEQRQRRLEGSVDRTGSDDLVAGIGGAGPEQLPGEAGRFATY